MNTQPTQQTHAIEVPVPDLKPERVQERLRRERAQQAIQTMPGWELTPDAKAIHRAREFPTPEIASLFSSYLTSLAGALSLPVAVHHSGVHMVMTLSAKPVRGRRMVVTDAVLDFARRLG